MEAAAAFLAVRPRSVAETRARLMSLGYQASLVQTAIERLTTIGYLDDEAFARAWVESRDRARPRGEHALRLELTRKGIDRQTIDGILDERTEAARANPPSSSAGNDSGAGVDSAGSPDVAAAERLLERRRPALLREADPRKRRQKAFTLLARNGFDPDVCRSVAARFDEERDPAIG
jgi:SOS response regulatory protein OraA/RecX